MKLGISREKEREREGEIEKEPVNLVGMMMDLVYGRGYLVYKRRQAGNKNESH